MHITSKQHKGSNRLCVCVMLLEGLPKLVLLLLIFALICCAELTEKKKFLVLNTS